MATISYYLDKRATTKDLAPLKMQIIHKGKAALISTGIKMNSACWDHKNQKVINHTRKVLIQSALTKYKLHAEDIILTRTIDDSIKNISVVDLKNIIRAEVFGYEIREEKKKGNFVEKFESFANSRRADGSKHTYLGALRSLQKFCPELDKYTFEDCNKEFFLKYISHLAANKVSNNTIYIYISKIKAVFNDAIDDGITNCYPFKKIHIRKEETKKRCLTLEDIKYIRDYPLKEKYAFFRDVFILSFYLLGINAVDLFKLTTDNITRDGRLEYTRQKTGKRFTIKLEPEALAIINKYKKEKTLIPLPYKIYPSVLSRMESIAIQKILDANGEAIYKHVTHYYCRHSWATIASDMDIPKEVISMGLGHSTGSVTDVYIKKNISKVDKANRQILDALK